MTTNANPLGRNGELLGELTVGQRVVLPDRASGRYTAQRDVDRLISLWKLRNKSKRNFSVRATRREVSVERIA